MAIVGNIFAWILRNPAFLAVIALSAAFVLITTSKNAEINTLRDSIDNPKTGWRKRNEVAQTIIGGLRASNTQLVSSTEAQNRGLAALNAKADAQGAKFDATMASLGIQTSGINRKLAIIDTSKPGADKCASAFALTRSLMQ